LCLLVCLFVRRSFVRSFVLLFFCKQPHTHNTQQHTHTHNTQTHAGGQTFKFATAGVVCASEYVVYLCISTFVSAPAFVSVCMCVCMHLCSCLCPSVLVRVCMSVCLFALVLEFVPLFVCT